LNEYFSDDVCTNFPVQLNAINQQTGYTYFWEFENAVPVTSTINNPVVNFTTIGNHIVQLTVRDAQNNIISHEVQTYNVHEPPVADFNFNQNGALVNFQNTSSSFVNSFNWYFGDGYTSNLENPNHFYLEAGQFQVILLAEGLCGTSTKIDTLTIQNTQIPQIDSTALEYVPPIATPFRYGANFSFYPPWSDEQLADIAAGNTLAQIEGVGVNALRTLLPHFFLDGFGYDIRASTFQHYHNLDIQGNTAILGYPVAEVRDTQYYCPTNQSVLFKNIYTNIWDDGSNATPYNDQNEFAKYIYETVKVYKDHVTYWQILPSPDFDEGSQKGGLVVGQYGNWYENNPDPCDYNLHAPIFYYIRMLRVAYEIIKTISPDDYVMIGGIGHASFIDAILRNTDNPLDGSVATAFPNKGGAYFDAIGLNIYPNYDGSVKYYDVNAGGIVYRRHSDAAADGMEAAKNRFETVLEQRGFDGVIHPKKIYTISECNIPRKKIEDELGGEQPQRNYIIKALVKAQKEGFSKLDVFALAETDFIEETNIPKNIMGLYQRIIDLPPYSRNYTNAGIAFYTTSKLLYGTTYDSLKTAQMNLPSNVEGAAFKDANGNFIYALWAKTTIDEAEVASATYSFPMSFGLSDLKMYRWDFATTDSIIQLSPNAIVLDAIPIFLSPSPTIITPPLASFEIQTNAVGCAGYEITFLNTSLNANSVVWHFEGGVPTISTMLNPTVVYPNEGVFDVSITAYNAAGEHTFTLNDVITINEIPQANYSFVVDDRTAFFNNISVQADSFYWDFGDGNNSFAFFPEHYYFEDGVFTVMLVAFNECGSDTTYQNVFIHTAPEANFSFQANSFCAPATLSFTDNSSANVTQRQWILLGANPVSSNEISFTANFLQAGIFPVTLIVANEYGSDTITQSITITSEITHSITDTLCGDEFIIVNGTVYNGEHLSGTETIFGGGGSGCDSIIQVNLTQEIQLIISITDTISPGEVYIYGDSVFTQPGSYSFYIDNPNSPCDQLVHLLLIASVAITEVDNKDIRIYPNPFLQQVFVEPLATNMEVKYIQIFNILGQPVSCKFSNNRAHLIVDTENIPTGVYQLLLDTSEGVYRTTIVKQ
ncbi:MAG: PKD domain-containing protein, partial [Saprospiraceae bacterium]